MNYNKLAEEAHENAVKHGFWETKVSNKHCLMLVFTEIAEMVEADRKGNYADIEAFEKYESRIAFDENFERHIKNTLEDEMADIAIRLFDLCGTLNITPTDRFESYRELFKDFRKNYQRHSFCERAFVLSPILCHADGASVTDDGSDKSLPDIIGAALFFLFAMAEDMNVDFIRHIELKMEYNETRPKKHGKKY